MQLLKIFHYGTRKKVKHSFGILKKIDILVTDIFPGSPSLINFIFLFHTVRYMLDCIINLSPVGEL
jgi:hypothetical protein